MSESLDTRVKALVYRHFADTSRRPALAPLARSLDVTTDELKASYARLFKSRVLVVDADGETIRMAPPFSGVPTQHRVNVGGRRSYYANCAWDSLGIVAAMRQPGTARRPTVSMAQLWGLAMAWYSDRLDPAARRPQPDEMRKIFADLGLSGDFWDPQADTLG